MIQFCAAIQTSSTTSKYLELCNNIQKQLTYTNDSSYITCISLTLALEAQELPSFLQHLQAEQREEKRTVAPAGAEQERRFGEHEICNIWQENEEQED